MWFRTDDGFLEHPKVIAAADALGGRNALGRIAAVWLEGGLYSARNLTDGFVPARVLGGFMTDPRPQQVAKALVAGGIWTLVPTGYQFHDWRDYNPSGAEIKAKRLKDRQRKDGELKANPTENLSIKENETKANSDPNDVGCENVDTTLETAVDDKVSEAETFPQLFRVENLWIPRGFQRFSARIPQPRARARAHLPSPRSRSSSRAEGQRVKRAPPVLSVFEVRPALLAATHLTIDRGGEFVEPDGSPNIGAVTAEVRQIAARDLRATWTHARELDAIIAAAIARRMQAKAAAQRRDRFWQRERATIRRLGTVR